MLKDYFKPVKKTFLSEQDLSSLKSFLLDLKKSLFELRFSKKVGTIKDISKFSKIKKNIARIKTEIFSRGERF